MLKIKLLCFCVPMDFILYEGLVLFLVPNKFTLSSSKTLWDMCCVLDRVVSGIYPSPSCNVLSLLSFP